MKQTTRELIEPYAYRISLVGSRVTCHPAPTGTDLDILVLLRNPNDAGNENINPGALFDALRTAGWVLGGSSPDNELSCYPTPAARFNSYTLGEENLILTFDGEFEMRFLAATSVAKRLNIMSKADRISLFQAVLYGNQDPGHPQGGDFLAVTKARNDLEGLI